MGLCASRAGSFAATYVRGEMVGGQIAPLGKPVPPECDPLFPIEGAQPSLQEVLLGREAAKVVAIEGRNGFPRIGAIRPGPAQGFQVSVEGPSESGSRYSKTKSEGAPEGPESAPGIWGTTRERRSGQSGQAFGLRRNIPAGALGFHLQSSLREARAQEKVWLMDPREPVPGRSDRAVGPLP